MVTNLVATLRAVGAGVAVESRIHNYTIPDLPKGYVFSDFSDGSGELMAKHHGKCHIGIRFCDRLIPMVQRMICSANAAGFHLNQALRGTYFRYGDLFDLHTEGLAFSLY
jgi:hypothetical protein